MTFDRLRIAAQTGQPLGAAMKQGGLGALRGASGTAAQFREHLRGYEAIGIDQMIFVSQAGRNRREHICEAVELLAHEVMPEFLDHHDAADNATRERVAPAREAPADYAIRSSMKV